MLEQRLRGRGTDSQEVIARRLAEAVNEMSHYAEFDYLIINDDFGTALADLASVFRSARLTQSLQQKRHQSLLSELLSKA